MANKLDSLKSMNSRQKVTAGVAVLIFLVVVWQVWGLIGGGGAPKKSTVSLTSAAKSTTTLKSPSSETMPSPSAGGGAPSPSTIPGTPSAQNQLPQPAVSPEMAEVMKAQQETEARYMQAVNQLQMLKIARDIADSNRDIMKAKLDAVIAEKKIVDTLSGPSTEQQGYSSSLVNPAAVTPGQQGKGAAIPPPPVEPGYTVVSVTELQNRWSAVLGSQGNLFSVHVGDVLPVDGSTVVSISRTGVVLEKDGVTKKISMVSII